MGSDELMAAPSGTSDLFQFTETFPITGCGFGSIYLQRTNIKKNKEANAVAICTDQSFYIMIH